MFAHIQVAVPPRKLTQQTNVEMRNANKFSSLGLNNKKGFIEKDDQTNVYLSGAKNMAEAIRKSH